MQKKRPDGGIYHAEARVAREGISGKPEVAYQMMNQIADNMRKKYDRDIERQGWDSSREILHEAFGMPDSHPVKVDKSFDWFRVNQKITFHPHEAYAMEYFEPLDELRMEVAKWLLPTTDQYTRAQGQVEIGLQRQRLRGQPR
jgi:hypothetical protein